MIETTLQTGIGTKVPEQVERTSAGPSLEEMAQSAVKGHEDAISDYSFCIFRIPEQGGRVLWEITNSCNYSCGYCIFSAEHGRIP